jgi:cell division inhibitor SulA
VCADINVLHDFWQHDDHYCCSALHTGGLTYTEVQRRSAASTVVPVVASNSLLLPGDGCSSLRAPLLRQLQQHGTRGQALLLPPGHMSIHD